MRCSDCTFSEVYIDDDVGIEVETVQLEGYGLNHEPIEED